MVKGWSGTSLRLDFFIYKVCRRQPNPLPVYADVDSRYQQFMRSPEKSAAIYALQAELDWSPQDGVNHVSAYIHEDFPLNTYQWQLFRCLLGQLNEEVAAAGTLSFTRRGGSDRIGSRMGVLLRRHAARGGRHDG